MNRNLGAGGPLLLGLVVALAGPGLASAQDWAGYGRDAQHTGLYPTGSQVPNRVRWSTPVDLAPQYAQFGNSSDLLTHYGSPLITRMNTVLVTVKTTATGGFQVEAHRGSDGTLLYALPTDYVLPSHNWIPSMGSTLTPKGNAVVVPGGGGTVLFRTFPDSASGSSTRLAFYGMSNYNQNPGLFASTIQISTPITADKAGNLFFGFVSNASTALPGYPNGIASGLARISTSGVGTFASAAAISGNLAMTKIALNCAPALTNDGTGVYVAVNSRNQGPGYLTLVDSATLTMKSSVFLTDPLSTPSRTIAASVPDDGTAAPTVGPDDDVYYGVLEGNFGSNNAQGWLLHFDKMLMTSKTPGGFGWDDSASIVPRSLVPGYTGTSPYLVLTKYNQYANFGKKNGQNKLAILDPNDTEVDSFTGATVMKEVISVLGITPNTDLPGVREWCVNAVAIDTVNKCAVVNCEDGHVYRWDFATNALSTGLRLDDPIGEAYTSTLIGPDGAVYAINNARLHSCVAR